MSRIVSVGGFLLMVAGIVALTVTKTLVSNHLPAIVLQVAAFALMRVFTEERLLRRQYPEYEAYSGRTKRLIPYLF